MSGSAEPLLAGAALDRPVDGPPSLENPGEVTLGYGRLAGILFIAGALLGVPALLLMEEAPPSTVVLLPIAGVVSGLLCLAAPWERLSRQWLNLPIALATIEVAIAVAVAGRPFTFYYLFIIIFAAYVLSTRAELVAQIALGLLALLAPLVVDPSDGRAALVQALVAIPSLGLAAAVIVYLRHRLEAKQMLYRRFAEEALRLAIQIRRQTAEASTPAGYPFPALRRRAEGVGVGVPHRLGAARRAAPQVAAELGRLQQDGGGHEVRRHRAPMPRVRQAALAASLVLCLPLLTAALAAAGVSLPGSATAAFEAVGVELPNQVDSAPEQTPASSGKPGGSDAAGRGRGGAVATDGPAASEGGEQVSTKPGDAPSGSSSNGGSQTTSQSPGADSPSASQPSGGAKPTATRSPAAAPQSAPAGGGHGNEAEARGPVPDPVNDLGAPPPPPAPPVPIPPLGGS